jgi:E3 ubiquitin-protein ligase DRIP
VRAKIFPFKRRKVKAPEIVPSVTLPVVRRKERSLSSLVVSTPRVSTQTTTNTASLTGRRSKPTARKTIRNSSFSVDKHHVKKEEYSTDDQQESSSSRETLTKVNQNVRPNSSAAEPSRVASRDEETDNGEEGWKPLNFLVEAANKSKSSKFTSEGSSAKSEPLQITDGQNRKNTIKELVQRPNKAQDEKNSADISLPEAMKPKKLRRNRPKKSAAPFGDSTVSPQALLDANYGIERKINQVWFSLVASKDQEGHANLPQIAANYLRIKNGSVPVSFIQKYLVRKLNLTSEDEVEIKCMGQAVVPTLQLNNLVELWIQTGAPADDNDRLSATIGSSAKDFVMVLAYSRKPIPPI